MPDAFKDDKVAIGLDNSPDHAAALGRLLGHWTFFERLLVGLMQYLLTIRYSVADIIYDEFTSTRAKILLLRRINHHFNSDVKIKKEIDQILNEAQKLNTKRNRFIHASWFGVSVTLALQFEHVLPSNHRKLGNPAKSFKPQEIQNVVEEIAKLSQSLQDLLTRLLGDPLVRSLI